MILRMSNFQYGFRIISIPAKRNDRGDVFNVVINREAEDLDYGSSSSISFAPMRLTWGREKQNQTSKQAPTRGVLRPVFAPKTHKATLIKIPGGA